MSIEDVLPTDARSMVSMSSSLVQTHLARTPASARLVVIGGQTASGKSALAIALARRFDGVLIGADSRQLYDGLPIASAGPTTSELSAVPHRLYGTVPPTATLTAADFLRAVDVAIAEVRSEGQLPIVVGGTGLYLRALRLGLDDAPPANDAIRAELNEALANDGLPSLVARLRSLDADAVSALDVHNPVRVMRALEILLAGGTLEGRSIDVVLQRPPRPSVASAAWLLAAPEARGVETRIVSRARAMFFPVFPADDVVVEAAALAAQIPADSALLRTMGVEEALAVHRGMLSREEAVAAVALRTRRYARRQRTWFRKEPWWTSVPSSR